MKIVFMGTPEFAAICLEEILESNHEVVGVVSVPDKPAGRGQRISQSAVTKLALDRGLNLLQPEKLRNPEFLEELNSLDADAFVVVAFRMLPKDVWQMPKNGTFNLHASLLPQYRGAAPINWAIINGETISGVTTFLIDEKIDTGNILLKEEVEILPDDNAGDLHNKFVESGKKLIVNTLDGLENGSIQPKPQRAVENLKPAPKIFKEDCQIDWSKPGPEIHNKIRGLSPYPAAWTQFEKDGKKINFKIFAGKFISSRGPDAEINAIRFEDDSVWIKTADGHYSIAELQPEGKRRMKSRDFINGLQDKTDWFIAQ